MDNVKPHSFRALISNRVVLVFLFISTLVLPTILLYPFNGDNDIWQWIATVFVHYHGLPYLAAWDQDFPGILIAHATAIYFLGPSMLAFRVVEYVAILVTVVALYRTSRLWLSKNESLLGTVFFSLFYVYGRLDCMGQRDNFAVLPILLAAYYFVKASRQKIFSSSLWFIVSGGAMVGVATCIRPTYALLLAVPILTLDGLKNFRAGLAALGGFSLPVLLMILPFAVMPDGIRQAYLAGIRYNADIGTHFPPDAARLSLYLHNLLALRTVMVFVLGAAWIIAYAIRRSRNISYTSLPHREGSFLVLFFAALLVGMFVQLNLAACHFTPFYACFIPVLTKMLCDLTRPLGRGRPAIIMAVLLLVALVLYPWGLVRSFIEGSFSIESAYRYFPGTLRFDQEDSSIASFLTQRTNPSEFIEVIGDPGVSWRTPRRESNRFQSEWLFMQPSPSGQFMDYQLEWRAEFLHSLQKTSPHYIVIERNPGETVSTLIRTNLSHTPEIRDFIQQHYALDTLLESHFLYARE